MVQVQWRTVTPEAAAAEFRAVVASSSSGGGRGGRGVEVVGREDFLDYHRVGRGDRQTAGMGPASCADQLLLLMQPSLPACLPALRPLLLLCGWVWLDCRTCVPSCRGRASSRRPSRQLGG